MCNVKVNVKCKCSMQNKYIYSRLIRKTKFYSNRPVNRKVKLVKISCHKVIKKLPGQNLSSRS